MKSTDADDDRTFEDPRLLTALREYTAAVEAGQQPDRTEFLARHADIADALAACLDGLDFVREAAPALCPPDETAPANDPLQPEAPLGDYRLVRQVGRGGMGIVYEAVQLSLGRRVALKVLPFAATLDPKQLQRFRNEATAAACLHHPNIVPVFAVGCERGVHFYAMQFIDGQNLAALIAQLRGDGKPPSDASTVDVPGVETIDPVEPAGTTERSSRASRGSREFFNRAAALGVQVAEALEYAHQQGVVHRDIKPANLLLDAHGHLWVTDFGLARFQTDAGLTATGDLIGTLRYMSPEQASGKPVIDPATDVYSLGATLFELLTLRPPFEGETRQAILHQVLTEDPVPPRRFDPAIPADLETIVLKAMAKAPQERYGSAREFADDLRRFLEDRPIQARRPTLLEKAAKWSRRHRSLVAGAILLLLLAVLGLGAGMLRIASEQAKTCAAYEAEARQRQRAEANLKRARHLLDFFAEVCAEEMPDRPELQDARRKLLTAALGYYQDFIEEHKDDPSIQAELIASRVRVARILQEIGSRADAIAALEQMGRLEMGGPAPLIMPQFPGAPPGFGVMMLLQQAPIQEDLGLSAEQVRQIGQLALRPVPPVPLEGTDQTRSKRVEELLAEVLRPAQVKRLQQIVWQHRGTHALRDADVARALELSVDQQEQIRQIHDEALRTMWQFTRPGLSPQEWRQKSEEFWKNVGEKVMAVLTQEQRHKWREMKGEPFRGEIRFGPSPVAGPPKLPG